jgi:hypothetical protein
LTSKIINLLVGREMYLLKEIKGQLARIQYLCLGAGWKVWGASF